MTRLFQATTWGQFWPRPSHYSPSIILNKGEIRARLGKFSRRPASPDPFVLSSRTLWNVRNISRQIPAEICLVCRWPFPERPRDRMSSGGWLSDACKGQEPKAEWRQKVKSSSQRGKRSGKICCICKFASFLSQKNWTFRPCISMLSNLKHDGKMLLMTVSLLYSSQTCCVLNIWKAIRKIGKG